MDFGIALQELKNGKKIERSGWNGKGMYVQMVTQGVTNEGIIIDNKGLVIRTPIGIFNNWIPSITDLLAEDWCILD